MKNHRFPWLRNRTTDNRKCEKARNIKEKRTIEMFSTVSRKQEEQASSRRDSSTCPCDCSEWSRAMECAPSYVAGALLRGDQRRRPIPASILLNTICVDDPRIPTLGIGGFYVVKKVRREKNKMFPSTLKYFIIKRKGTLH